MEDLINYAMQIQKLAAENNVNTKLIEHSIDIVEKAEEEIVLLKAVLGANVSKLSEAIAITNGKIQKEIIKKEINKL